MKVARWPPKTILANPNSARPSLSTKASIARTGLSWYIQSSRYSGNTVACPRSVPSTKRFIRSPANYAGIITPESPHPTAFSHSQGQERRFGPRPPTVRSSFNCMHRAALPRTAGRCQ